MALILAGCSGQAAATATLEVTATPVPTPSPTPFDVPKAFLPQIVAATSANMSITGTLDVGSETGTVSGSLTYVGGDIDQKMTVSLGGTPSTTDTVHKGGYGYTKVGGGPWLPDAVPPRSGSDLSSLLKGLTTLTDTGTETKGGTVVHRLELPAGTVLSRAAFGLTDPAMTNAKIDLAFYAADDGRPVIISVTATWTQAGRPVKMVLNMWFVQIGGNLEIRVPERVWTPFTSTRFYYRLDVPDDWDVSTSDKTVDRLASPTDTFALVARSKTGGYTLNDIAKAEVATNKAQGFALVTNASDTLAGKQARFITYHATIDRKKWVAYEVMAIDGDYVYDVFAFAPAGTAVTDLDTFRLILGTFAFS